jgi:hypothetical protein
MRRTFLADHAAQSDARATIDGTELNGEALKALTSGLLADRNARRKAWRFNRHCVECGKMIDHDSNSGVLVVDGRARVACKRKCFARAVMKANPTFCIKRVMPL